MVPTNITNIYLTSVLIMIMKEVGPSSLPVGQPYVKQGASLCKGCTTQVTMHGEAFRCNKWTSHAGPIPVREPYQSGDLPI